MRAPGARGCVWPGREAGPAAIGDIMLKNIKNSDAAVTAMLSLLPTSGTLAGIAVGLAGLINSRANGGITTWADEMLVVAALGFLLVCYLIFFAIWTTGKSGSTTMMQVIDIIFLLSLTLVVFSGFVVVCALF